MVKESESINLIFLLNPEQKKCEFMIRDRDFRSRFSALFARFGAHHHDIDWMTMICITKFPNRDSDLNYDSDLKSWFGPSCWMANQNWDCAPNHDLDPKILQSWSRTRHLWNSCEVLPITWSRSRNTFRDTNKIYLWVTERESFFEEQLWNI